MEQRLVYLDRLKVFLTILVVLHHTSITYGGSGSWYYMEAGDHVLAEAVLTLFTAVNQSFFMGLFFFISGWATPASYERKGASRFLKERLVRFGLPLLLFTLVFDPLLWYVSSGYTGTFAAFLKERILPQPLAGVTGFETGPLWFIFTLLIFNMGYILYRKLPSSLTSKFNPATLTGSMVAAYLLLTGASNFLIRLVMPVGEEVLNLQLAYFPAYIGLYMAGIAAYRGGWLDRLTAKGARRSAWLAAGIILLLPIVMIAGGALEGNQGAFEGGFTWQSAFYSFADPILGLAISYLLLVRFREKHNQAPTKLSRLLSAHAFDVYVLHALVVVYVSYALRGLELHPLIKFPLAGSLSVAVCYGAAVFMRILLQKKRISHSIPVSERG